MKNIFTLTCMVSVNIANKILSIKYKFEFGFVRTRLDMGMVKNDAFLFKSISHYKNTSKLFLVSGYS